MNAKQWREWAVEKYHEAADEQRRDYDASMDVGMPEHMIRSLCDELAQLSGSRDLFGEPSE